MIYARTFVNENFLSLAFRSIEMVANAMDFAFRMVRALHLNSNLCLRKLRLLVPRDSHA